MTVVTIWREIERKSERSYTADLETERESLRILGLEHAPHRTALYRTGKRISEEYMRRLNQKILERLKPAKPSWVKTCLLGEILSSLADVISTAIHR